MPPAPDLPADKTLLDAVMFIASLVSKPREIDVQLDRVRTITAQRSVAQLTTEDTRVLSEVYNYLENYLIAKESLRSFTRDSIRARLRDHLQGSQQSRRAHPLIIIWVLALGSGAAAVALPDTIMPLTVRAILAMTLFLAILHLGAVWLFLRGLRNFKDRIRQAYIPICIGIVLVGITLFQVPIAVALGEDDAIWFRYIASSAAIPVAGVLFYIGMRRFAQLGGVQSWLLSGKLVLALCVGLALVVVALPRPSDLPNLVLVASLSILTVGAVLSAVTAAITFKVRQALSAAYRQPMMWFMGTLVISAFSCVQYGGLQFFATTAQPYNPAGLAIIPLLLSGLVILKAGSSFSKIDSELAKTTKL